MGNHKFRIAPTFVKKEGEDQGQLEKAVELVRDMLSSVELTLPIIFQLKLNICDQKQ